MQRRRDDRGLKVLQHDFRIGDPDNAFLPYWEATDVIAGQSDDLVASAHIRPGKAMLVIANWSTEPVDVDLTLDLAALGLQNLPGLTATEVVDGVQFGLEDGHLRGALGPRDYRLVLLSAAK